MAERLDFCWVYDREPGEIFRILTRLEHLEEKARHLGHHDHIVMELRERNGVFRSVSRRQVGGKLSCRTPSCIRPRNPITQTQLWQPPSWDGCRRYTTVVEIGSLPVSVVGQGTLTATGCDGTRYDVGLDIRVTQRMLGAKIEQIVATQLARTIQAEHEFRQLWLNRFSFGRRSDSMS